MIRLHLDGCGLKEDEKLWEIGRGFIVRDLPKTEEELRKYPAFEFENWAVVALGGIPKDCAGGVPARNESIRREESVVRSP